MSVRQLVVLGGCCKVSQGLVVLGKPEVCRLEVDTVVLLSDSERLSPFTTSLQHAELFALSCCYCAVAVD